MEAAAIEHRQGWWLLAVVAVALGLLIAAFAPVKLKVFSIALIGLPYLVAIPHVEGPVFSHSDPAVVTALTGLHRAFIIASGASNLVFWLVLGLLCAALMLRAVGASRSANEHAHVTG